MHNSAIERGRGRPSASETRRQSSREALLDAGLRMFTERGYRGAAVDAIVSSAGLSKGTFYWNFPSKRDLFETLIDERLDRPIRELTNLIAAAPAESDASLEASRVFAELAGREREAILLSGEYWALAARDPKLRRRYAKRQAELRDALASALEWRAQTLNAPPFDPPAGEIATAFLALSGGLSRIRLIDPEAVPDQLLGKVLALVYAGLVAKSEASS